MVAAVPAVLEVDHEWDVSIGLQLNKDGNMFVDTEEVLFRPTGVMLGRG